MLYVFSMILGLLSVRYPSYRTCSEYDLPAGFMFALCTFLLKCHVSHPLLIPVCLFAAAADLRTGEIPDLSSLLILIYAAYCRVFDPFSIIILFVTTLLSINQMLGFGDVKLLSAWSVLFGIGTLKAVMSASFTALPFLEVMKGAVKARLPGSLNRTQFLSTNTSSTSLRMVRD